MTTSVRVAHTVLTIQFITDERLLIPGGSVAIRGQHLRIGPGEAGDNFHYMSPQEQMAMYGVQRYILVTAEDEYGRGVENEDIGVVLDPNAVGYISPEETYTEPEGDHEGLRALGEMKPRKTHIVYDDDEDDEGTEEEEEEKPRAKKSSKVKAKKTSKKKRASRED